MKSETFAKLHVEMEAANFNRINKFERKEALGNWLAEALHVAGESREEMNNWEKENFRQAILDLEAGLYLAAKHHLYCATMPAAPKVNFSEDMVQSLAKITPQLLFAEATRTRIEKFRQHPVFRWAEPD